MKFKFSLFSFLVFLIPSVALSQTIVPLLSSDGKVFVAAQVNVIDESTDDSKLARSIQTGKEFLDVIKKSGLNDKSYSYFSSNDKSRSKVKSGNSPLNLEMFRKRVESVSYPNPGISWGDYLLVPVKYQLKGRVIGFREDYYCKDDQCLKSIKEYGQVMENVYAVFENDFQKTFEGQLSLELTNAGKSTILSASGPGKSFEVVKQNPVNSNGSNALHLGVSIIGLGESQCIQCEALNVSDDASYAINNTVRELATKINSLDSSSDRQDRALSIFKKYSTKVNSDTTIAMADWSSASPDRVSVDISSYLLKLEQSMEGKIVGHIPDGEYAYLIISNKPSDSKDNATQFQIYVMKLDVASDGQKRYVFDPEPSRDLESQYLVYDGEFLRAIHSIIKSVK